MKNQISEINKEASPKHAQTKQNQKLREEIKSSFFGKKLSTYFQLRNVTQTDKKDALSRSRNMDAIYIERIYIYIYTYTSDARIAIRCFGLTLRFGDAQG